MENMDMEYYENHGAEYEEEMAMASEELPPEMEDGDNVPTLEQQNWGLIYYLRDNISTFTAEQAGTLTQLIKDTSKANTPKARLYAEALTLKDNIDKLSKFLKGYNRDGIRNVKALKLTDAQVFLMQHQLDLEQELYDILTARLSIFDVYRTEIDGEDIEVVKE